MPVLVEGPDESANFDDVRLLTQLVLEDLFKPLMENEGQGRLIEIVDANNHRKRVVPGLGILHHDLVCT